MPWGSDTPTANQDMDTTAESDDEIEPPAKLVERRILQDLLVNVDHVPSMHHFSPELFAFLFPAGMDAAFRYRFVRELLPFLQRKQFAGNMNKVSRKFKRISPTGQRFKILS
jgi:hypothetical protein